MITRLADLLDSHLQQRAQTLAMVSTAIAGLLVAALIAALQAGHLVVRWAMGITLAFVLLVTFAA